MEVVVVIVATSIIYILYSNINNHDRIMFLFDEQRLKKEGNNETILYTHSSYLNQEAVYLRSKEAKCSFIMQFIMHRFYCMSMSFTFSSLVHKAE
jgi:hypothetical protein